MNRRFFLLFIATLSACQPSLEKADPSSPIATHPIIENIPLCDRLWENLDSEKILFLGPTFKEELSAYLIDHPKANPSISKALPLLNGWTVPLQYHSKYDNTPHPFWVRIPYKPGKPKGVLLVLGELESDLHKLEGYEEYWIVMAPSRGNLNYQLIAEAEIWQALETTQTLYPQTTQLPLYLVATGPAADSALLIANRLPWRFKGVAFSGGKLGLNLQNLVNIPISYFSSQMEGNDPSNLSPWGRQHLIRRLKSLGNTQATVSPSLKKALDFLHKSNNDSSSIHHTFLAYNAAKVSPWLAITSKRCEEERVSVVTHINKQELYVEAANASSITIESSLLPASINHIRFNGDLYALPKSKKRITIGEGSQSLIGTAKTYRPNHFLDFFRNEPLVVVYQDLECEEGYKQSAKNLAKQLSQLQFNGLHTEKIQLPLLPLSEYHTINFPHRLIAVGKECQLRSIIEKSKGYYPLNRDQNTLRVGYTTLALNKTEDPLTYSLTYPPEQELFCRLAQLLVAEDQKGLQTLTQHYQSATVLYDSSDFIAWTRSNNNDRLKATFTFDGFWGSSNYPSTQIAIPSFPKEVWEQQIRDLLVTETRTPFLMIPPCTDAVISPPQLLTPASLAQFIPEKHFALVRFTSKTSFRVAERLLNSFLLHYPDGDATLITRAQQQKTPLCLDARLLNDLSPVERETLDYTILPYSLQEMLTEHFLNDPTAFGKELLRIHNYLI